MITNVFGRLLGVAVISLYASHVQAQADIDDLLKESAADAEKLVVAYTTPFMKSISVGLTQGWYNTAKPHKIAGVDLTITVSALTIPDKETFYEPAKLNLERISLTSQSPGYPKAPTIFGVNETPVFEENLTGEDFDGPAGLGLKDEIGKNIMPVPMAHLGFGLPKNTDIKIRFIPSIDLGDEGALNLWGLGVMHDIKQHIPGLKHLPFDLSVLAAYTKFNLTYNHDDGSINGENQRSEFVMNATTIQGLISKKFSVLTLYGGIGYNIAKSQLAVKGSYDIDENNVISAEERDPVNLKLASSGPRATAGFRLKLAVITLHADYTFQKYKTFTAGFGISVR